MDRSYLFTDCHVEVTGTVEYRCAGREREGGNLVILLAGHAPQPQQLQCLEKGVEILAEAGGEVNENEIKGDYCE